jgi:Obg family GTPase CgtA-like protein
MFAMKLRKLGVDEKLRELGVQDDDTVLILGYEYQFYD